MKLLIILEESGYQARLAGGCVRDRQLGLAPKDFDIATSALPDQVSSIFQQKGFKVVPTGIDHGTVTVVTKNGPLEITTLRRDVHTDGRHAKVVYGSTFEDDAARRDFTVNAMFEDRTGQVYDFFHGRQHLAERKLVFVGDPDQRIREDFLRILRFFRFWARFSFHPDNAALDAISRNVLGLSRVSQERITSELLGLLQADTPSAALHGMANTGILDKILPEARVDPRILLSIDSLKFSKMAILPVCRLALLLPPSMTGKETEKLSRRLRLSNPQGKILQMALSGMEKLPSISDKNSGVMDFIDICEGEGGEGSFAAVFVPTWIVANPAYSLKLKKMYDLEFTMGHLRRRPLPISGNDLMAKFSLAPGPELGRLIDELRKRYRDLEWTRPEEGFEIGRQLVLRK